MRRIAIVAVLVAAGLTGTAQAAERTIAEQVRPTAVKAHGRIALFSRWDGSAYHLAISVRAGAPRDLPLPPQATPFDADIGPDTRGRPTVVVSRCAPDCHVDLLRIGTAQLRRLPGVVGTRPSLWRGRIAWVTGGRVLVRDLMSGRARALPGVPRGAQVDELELTDRRAAYTTTVHSLTSGGLCGQRDVRLVVVRTRRVTLVGSQSCGLAGQSWTGPSFAGAWLYVSRDCNGQESCGPSKYGAIRYHLRTGAYELAPYDRGLIGWAYDGANSAYEVRNVCTFYESDPPPCKVAHVAGLRFRTLVRPPVPRP